MNTPKRIVIIDHMGVSDPLDAIAKALGRQLHEDFCPKFNISSSCAVIAMHGMHLPTSSAVVPEDDDWLIGLFRDADQPGALGYHDETLAGLPLAKVFPILDAQDGSALSVTISHELLEMVADPYLSLAVQSHDGRFWAYEICDAVENDQYLIDGVPVSNFVTPQYFQPPQNLAGVQLDQMNLIKKPFEVRPGGYMQWNRGNGWHQVMHQEIAPRAYRRDLAGRAHRRAAAGLIEPPDVDSKFSR